jgi:serine/threonine protein kinase
VHPFGLPGGREVKFPNGSEVAGYRIEELLCHGSMAAVYEATQLSLQRTVALKVLADEFGEDPVFRERFKREGVLQAKLDHPHIVAIYEAGEAEEGLFLAMCLIRGPTLKEIIVPQEGLDTGRALHLLRAVAEGLDAAHEVGLIHRDVKPQNILIGADDHAYLADFGLTKGVGGATLTGSGQFIGTIDYVCPEQVRGVGVCPQSDVYGLASVLYECLTGEVPYPKNSDAAVLYAHAAEPPPSVTERRPDLPHEIDDVIAKGMAKASDDRYQSAWKLMRSAEAALGEEASRPPARSQAR